MKPGLRHLFFFFVVCSFLFLPATVGAHKPIWASGTEIRIPDLRTSFAAYRTLADSSQIDTFVFDGRAGQSLRGKVSIPRLAGLDTFTVRAALFGPGLPAAAHDLLPAEHPEGLGAVVFPSEFSSDFFEPFTQTSYWGRQAFVLSLPEDGTYYLLVWQPAGETGKYVLATGSEERFSLTDLVRFPLWWVRVHIFFGHTPYLVAGGAAIVMLATVLIVRRRYRATSRQQ